MKPTRAEVRAASTGVQASRRVLPPTRGNFFHPLGSCNHSPGNHSSENQTQAFSIQPSVYVTNIAPETSIEFLVATFAVFGTVLDAYFICSRGTPPTSGTSCASSVHAPMPSAIVKFDSWTAAERAYNHFANSSTLAVRYARARSDALGVSISARRLFVGQLPTDVTETDIRAYFAQFGTIIDVSLLKTKSPSQQSCAFVEYETWCACDKAIAAGHGAYIVSDPKRQKPMVVKYAKSKDRSVNIFVRAHTGSLQDLLSSHPHGPSSYASLSYTSLSYPSSPPTTGYFVCPEQMISHSLPAYWPAEAYQSPFLEYGQQPPPGYVPMQPGHAVHSTPSFTSIPGMASDLSPVISPVISPVMSSMMSSMTIGGLPLPHEDVDSRKIFVGQLSRTVNEEDIAAMFAPFGPIEHVTVLRTAARCGFVTFLSRHQALVAVEAMHGVVPYSGTRPLVVRLASSRRAEGVAPGAVSANSDASESVTESETEGETESEAPDT